MKSLSQNDNINNSSPAKNILDKKLWEMFRQTSEQYSFTKIQGLDIICPDVSELIDEIAEIHPLSTLSLDDEIPIISKYLKYLFLDSILSFTDPFRLSNKTFESLSRKECNQRINEVLKCMKEDFSINSQKDDDVLKVYNRVKKYKIVWNIKKDEVNLT